MTEAEVGMMQPQAKESWQSLERVKEHLLSQSAQKTSHYRHLEFSHIRCILDSRPPELLDTEFVLF